MTSHVCYIEDNLGNEVNTKLPPLSKESPKTKIMELQLD